MLLAAESFKQIKRMCLCLCYPKQITIQENIVGRGKEERGEEKKYIAQ